MSHFTPQSKPFPAVWDATMRRDFVACPEKFRRAFVDQIAPQGLSSIHLHAGGAFATGLETVRLAYWRDGASPEQALEQGVAAVIRAWGDRPDPPEDAPPSEANKSLHRIVGGLVHYFTEYPIDRDLLQPYLLEDGKPCVEVSFCLPIEDCLHPETGEPILYAGRFDMVGVREGTLLIVDEKTTSQLGSTWSAKWQLRAQFIGYCWGARSFGIPVGGALIRGISFLKNGYEHAQALVYHDQFQIEKWLLNLKLDINRAKTYWSQGYWPDNLDESCQAYRGCPYARLCSTPAPDNVIPIYYQTRVWDPLKRDEEA